MNKFEIVPGTYDLAPQLADRLWDVDRQDLKLMLDLDPRPGVEACMQVSDECWFLLRRGVPVAAGGVASSGDMGVPWFLASEDIQDRDVRFRLAVWSKRCVERWASQFKWLENQILAQHDKALKWARWLGFKVEDPKPWGVAHWPCCRIHRRA